MTDYEFAIISFLCSIMLTIVFICTKPQFIYVYESPPPIQETPIVIHIHHTFEPEYKHLQYHYKKNLISDKRNYTIKLQIVNDKEVSSSNEGNSEIIEEVEIISRHNPIDEYPNLSQIYNFLQTQMGYNDIISSAIIGNIMQEVSGGSFDIPYNARNDKNGGHYGIMQWSHYWFPEVKTNWTLSEQLNYFKQTIRIKFNETDSQAYTTFLNSSSIEEATTLFCRCYLQPYSKEECLDNRIAYAYKFYENFIAIKN